MSTTSPAEVYPRVLVVRPLGRGGVGAVVDLVAPVVGAVVADRVHGGFDVVHLHPSFRWRALVRDSLRARRARESGARVVVQLHGWSRRLAAHVDRDPLARALLRRTLLRADALLVVDPRLGDALVRWGADSARVRLVPNPYDPASVPPERVPGPPMVLFLGRLEPGKGADVLVEATRGLNVDVVVAGEGSLLEDLRRRGGARVSFPGWVEGAAKRALLARASVLALPSVEEAAPLAVLEALAAGVPVVATSTGAIPELVGDAGLLVDDPTPDAVRAALREALARTFPARDVSAHDPSAVAAVWADVYRCC